VERNVFVPQGQVIITQPFMAGKELTISKKMRPVGTPEKKKYDLFITATS